MDSNRASELGDRDLRENTSKSRGADVECALAARMEGVNWGSVISNLRH